MKTEDKMQICKMAFVICCLTVCTILNIQIAILKKQIQTVEYAQERIRQMEEEEIENSELHREALSEEADVIVGDVQDFLREYRGISYRVQCGQMSAKLWNLERTEGLAE